MIFKKWLLFFEDKKLSAVRKVLETLLFLALGSFESKTVRGTVLAWAYEGVQN